MSALLPPNASALERALAEASTFDLPVDLPRLRDVDRCPPELLPWLAWSLHVDGWDNTASVEEKRELIRLSVLLHQKKGTPWALERALATLGLEVEVIDQARQRARYAELAPDRLDGTWSLDASRHIRPLELAARLPQLQHWAQFIVRTNLASLGLAERVERLAALVEEWKPARAWPLFIFWLAFELQAPSQAASMLRLDKRIEARYPWCGRVVSDRAPARWSLGREARPVTLAQPFGAFRLGERRGGAAWHLHGCRIASQTLMRSTLEASAYRLPALAEPDRRLNGSWRLGGRAAELLGHTQIASSSQIAVAPALELVPRTAVDLVYPATSATLARRVRLSAWRRLDGRWALGAAAQARPFGFRMGRDRTLPIDTATTLVAQASTCATPERLGGQALRLATVRRRLDGRWALGAEQRLGRFRLDGRRLRARRFTRHRRLGQFALGPVRRLRLNGGWQVGGPARPTFTFHIVKETSHG
ncbi:phage tail protein I [Azotobacter beijerinckii]|uniref:Phage tail protein, P2 protein I family n=1 Tax=Azotobacter beijerinckii TaxID=170623 RepID=A0A1I0ZXT2_9GAMM|nr:phage tail protein I [Azotobacter beijerinckii]SFB30574.1 phage tail protein, P2 protein I family [Azotobacter beijerinckii]